MSLDLFTHNRRAYEQASAMLDRTGKAAIVHPTGTGKSFIAFKLVEEHPNESILWLSPSEVIYKTQCENLHHVEPSLSLENVRFFTYAKLMMLTAEEITSIADACPTYIILDEFHRCGAACWGQGVERLLRACKDAKLLGLSATNIRYLDNQRDMADELFDGNIASEITLGETIVRGILPAPKYVTTIFKYQQALEKYQQRVDIRRGYGQKDACQRYLDALRRALDKAEGLPQIFARHITKKSGRYIVFCSGFEHMQEVAASIPEWFAEVDKEPHIYTAYSEDPQTSRAFAEFKADESGHLKLLLCIDMLNEGVHVKGISGVILFRPTVSPTLYKQQIGRALTAGEDGTPLILDIVNNYEGLCSIGYLQEEMRTAIQRMYEAGEGGEVVNEKFEVIEQIEDCQKLFRRLESSLSSSWEQYYHAASLYAAEHGNLEVPKKYTTEEGLSLGLWLITQRRVRSGKQSGILTDSQIARLDSIGMVWDNLSDAAWEQSFEYAKAYYAEHGDLFVPARYRTPDGFALGKWITNLRRGYAENKETSLLNAERIVRLEKIGMVWDILAFKWEQHFSAAAAYYKEHGNLEVPVNYKTETGLALGVWIRNQRQARQEKTAGRLNPEQIMRLDAIGMNWENTYDIIWEKAYLKAKEYAQKNGDLEIPLNYVTPDGTQLGKWIRRQRYARQCPEKSNAVLTTERIARLNAIGMVWEQEDSWEHRYQLAREYCIENGNTNIPAKYKTADGIWLGRWLYEQKRLCAGTTKGRPLLPEQRQKLEKLGIV